GVETGAGPVPHVVASVGSGALADVDDVVVAGSGVVGDMEIDDGARGERSDRRSQRGPEGEAGRTDGQRRSAQSHLHSSTWPSFANHFSLGSRLGSDSRQAIQSNGD